MNWYYIGLGLFALTIAVLLWLRADKVARNQDEIARFLFRGLAPDTDPLGVKASGVLVGMGGIALIVLGLFGRWL